MQTLNTERLILREWTIDDCADLYSYAKNEKVGSMAGWKPHASIDESQQIIKMFIADDDTWAIEDKSSGRVIGSVGLHQTKKDGMTYDRELGYVLSEEYWGRGIIPEACRAVLDFAFCTLHLNKIIVSHFSFNMQSKRVIEKLGFTYICHLDDSWNRYDGAVLSEDVYYLDNAGQEGK